MTTSDRVEKGLPPPLFAIVFLPCGIRAGLVGVTLSYVLAKHGVSVAAIAGLHALGLLPTTWQFFMGPVVDVSLTSKRWYLTAVGVLTLCLVAFALSPLTPAAMPFLDALGLIAGLSATLVWSAASAVMAHTTPAEKRGAAAGWTQVAHMGGAGLGGGLGLWIVTHAGGPRVAILVMALACLACALPVLMTRVARHPAGVRLTDRARGMAAEVWDFARTRRGILTILLLLLPMDMGAATTLLPTVAGQWRASSDLVALFGGALVGLAVMPGCIIGGYLCTRFPPRTVYISGSLAFGLGEALMALSPHTPTTYAVFSLLNAFLAGLANGPYSGVIFASMGSKAAATLGSILSSLGQLPLLLVTLVVGMVETRHGADAMLLAEAGLAVISVVGYVALASSWRRDTIATLVPAGI